MTIVFTIITVLAFMNGNVETSVGDEFYTADECLEVAKYAQPIMQEHPEIANAVIMCVSHPQSVET